MANPVPTHRAASSPVWSPETAPEPVLWEGPGGEVLVVRGEAPVEALHRVVSQDLRPLSVGDSRLALLLAPKGQVRGVMAVFPRREDVLLLAPEGAGEELAAALNRYLLLSRCRVEPVTPAAQFALFGAGWRRLAGNSGMDLVVEGSGDEEVWWLGRHVSGLPGAVAVAPGQGGARRLAALAAGLPPVAAEDVELARVNRGLPAWGKEITEATLPPEVGLEREAVSSSKGCYVGQEVMARIEAYGHVNRTLVGVVQNHGPEGVPALPLDLAPSGGDRSRGQLTSAVRHPDHGVVGLALVRREVAAPGTELSGSGRRFRVAALPLW